MYQPSVPLDGARRPILLFAFVLPVLLAVMLGHLATSAHEPNELDQQYTLSQASTQQQVAQIGTTFGSNMSVKVCAVFSNPCQALNGIDVTFTAEPATDGASGTFTNGGGTVTVTSGSNGIATATAFRANSVAGSYTVRVVANEPTPHHAVPTFFFFTNSSADPATKVATISDGVGRQLTTQINTTFSPNLSLVTLNGSNGYAVGVSVVFSAPATGASGTFTNGTTTYVGTTGSTGLVEAPAFRANSIVGEYVVTATISGIQTINGTPMSLSFPMRNSGTSAVGVPVLISAAAGNAQQVGVLSPYPTNLQIVVLDGRGDYVTGASVTFTTPASGPSATFSGGSRVFTTATGSTGLATASQLTSNAIAGQFSVDVTVTKNNVTLTSAIVLINGRVMTTTTLTKDPAGNSVYGQPVVLTATVRPVAGNYVPTGPVTFSQGGTPIASCTSVTPSGGVATCTLSGLSAPESNWLAVGNYSYSASYFGDTLSQPSASTTVSHRVDKASTTVGLVSSKPEFVIEGESVTFTATVNVTAPGRGNPLGSVTFTSSDGTALTGSALANGTATVTTSGLDVGTPLITATYSGSTSFNGSTASITQNVYTVPEVTTDPLSDQVLVGETASFTAEASGFPTPTVQWQVSSDNGVSFTNIEGATSTTYSLTAVRDDDQRQYRAVFSNPAGSDTSAAATLTVRQPPFFTSESETTFTVGVEGLFAIEADGHLPPTISQTGETLPTGVTFDPETGALSGIPEDGTGGVYDLEFTATNSVDPDAVQEFTLTINEEPEFTSAAATTFVVGSAGVFTVSADGYPSPTFSTDGHLPGGVTLSPDGELSGTPTEGGLFTFTITAGNGVGEEATQGFSLQVNQAPTFESEAAATFTVGQPDSFTVAATGIPASTISQTSGSLPAGIEFNPVTGELSGTPADGAGNAYPLEFTATNGIAPDAVQSFTLTVHEEPEFTSEDEIIFILNNPGQFSFTASGYPAPAFSTAEPLPEGVTLTAGGLLSGTPSEAGTFQLNVSASNGVGQGATQAFTLIVGEPPSFSSAAAATFVVGDDGTFTLTALGTAPIAFRLTSGQLPDGVVFDAESGVLAGTPGNGTGGVYELEFVATNAIQPDAVQQFTLTVHESPEFTNDAAATFTAASEASFAFTTSGYPVPVISMSGTLPDGLSFTNGVLSGTPVASGSAELTMTASNEIGDDATQTFTLTIEKASQASLALSVSPAAGVIGDRLALEVTGGSGSGQISYDVGESTACILGTGTDAGMLVVIHGSGTCVVIAVKASDQAYLAATSDPVTVTVSPAPTVLNVQQVTGTFDSLFTFTATLSADGIPVPGKEVSFTGPSGMDLGSATTDQSGVATLASVSLSGIDAGTYTDDLAATFAGDADYDGTSSQATLTVEKAAGAVRITNLPASAGVGNNVVIAFETSGDGTPSAESLTPTTCTVDESGVVTFTLESECRLLPSVTEGRNYLAADGAMQAVTVTAPARKATTTTLASSTNPATVGQVVTLTAQVAPDVRSGTVTFMVDGRSIGTVTISRRGLASMAMPTASAGNFNVRAVFDGTTTHAGSQSAVLVQVVQAPTATQTTTALSSSTNPAVAGQPVTFTATVSPASATGTVTFTADRQVLGMGTVSGGQATLTISLKKGTYNVVATYNGDATHTTSSAAPLSQSVVQPKDGSSATSGTQSQSVQEQPTATPVPPTVVAPTPVPPTSVPPTEAPPTELPPTEAPPTDVPPGDVSDEDEDGG